MAFTKEIIDFAGLSDSDIKSKLVELNIPLTPDEVLKIQNEMLGRAPSLAELILFSIQGSEHCSYKSSRNHLKQFTTEGPDVVLGAKEDAGVVAVATDNNGHRWCIVMSHESHNHPSQIVPYEGAATGVGGNVRDVLCMGAEVIAVTDSFRFGNINNNKTKWIHDGVVAGVAGYGNPLGIPNIGGDLYFHEGYNENCLVTLVTLGIVREDDIIHSYAPKNADGFDLILLGKPTDNSGFGGASFASLELEEEMKEQNKGAVQEPNAFLERHLLKSSYALFDILKEKGLIDKIGFKDLGAGGVACASVELAETSGYGAEVWMDKIHIGMDGLHPSVYLCSETQERFMWVCSPDVTPIVLDHYNSVFDLPGVSEGARASVIGKIRNDGQYIVHNGYEEIVNAPAKEVTEGFLYDRPYKARKQIFTEPELPEPTDYNQVLLDILSHENMASREPIYEQYDKQVQGRIHTETGLADSGVLAPFNSENYPEEIRNIGIALSTDHNPRYGLIDPYWGGVNAVVESMRNVAAVGATPHALSDCLCFGNPEKPNQMWEFVEATRGVSDACNAITLKDNPNDATPIIAGNVSFYNESKRGAIPPSPIVSCLGRLKDVNNTIPMHFQKSDSVLLMIGERKDELGGSVYYSLFDELGANVPKPNLKEVKNQIFALTDCIDAGLILSCHDIADGGIASAIAEMTFENAIGCKVKIDSELSTDKILFSETGGFALEVSPENLDKINTVFSKYGLNAIEIGTTGGSKIQINGVIKVSVNKTKEAWTNGLRNKL
ncbi:MAG: phosphoribosylformylglycinamidine synthase subunit PurL [Candidatus Marinimicrobia bacterium]|jgi:phosphoribosylformylglycinamidine synthase|nr:phosphoribosylformylglycinamidine synthase subunit PurL [Candidatus Neomarinimicrobiota bacterium]MBT3829529.1 phosphoribosylformylglycinamidine synthase subunit PurL [Candidatus Neomarinimicrobiota bacterium]MBT3998214.1 phosphoribosylformylglycinamidine synthase subunit PurL [Candidatus Neomarinimicrobiota bacterium]MBT4281602.1 phosphoribosylformylglycinamidine synthase subunit PurL [Candidatus Neomarinimicrobiota bacterium]MBT4569166.1 phosphoribosylformylglycinamidine synthase subunit P